MKNDPPRPVRPLPPMFVGDVLPPDPLPIPPQALVAGTTEAAALLPGDLRVTVEGTTAGRLPLIAAGLLVVLLGGMGIVNALDPYAFPEDRVGGYTVVVALCAALAWLAYRHLIRNHKEYRLGDEGIVLQVLHGADPRPWITRIPWTEIEDYTVEMHDETVYLRVESVRGYTVSLRDRPARLSTREFVRRFIETADLYPRAVRPQSVSASHGDENARVGGCLGFAALYVAGEIARRTLDLSSGQQMAGYGIVGVAVFVLYLWHTLDDHDVAYADRTSKRLIARLRRWLRRVLDIQQI